MSKGRKKSYRIRAPLTDMEKDKIVLLTRQGIKAKYVAERLNIHPSTVSIVVRERGEG